MKSKLNANAKIFVPNARKNVDLKPPKIISPKPIRLLPSNTIKNLERMSKNN